MRKAKSITINGKSLCIQADETYRDVIDRIETDKELSTLLVMEDGRLKELFHLPKDGAEVQAVTMKTAAGFSTYMRSVMLLLFRVLDEMEGLANRTTLHYSAGSGYYFTIEGMEKVPQDLLEKAEQRMHALAQMDLPIRKKTIPTDSAIAYFESCGMLDKARLLKFRRASGVNLYALGDYQDYFYGYMADRTGVLRNFRLLGYDEGFVLQLPDRRDPGSMGSFEPSRKLFEVQKSSGRWAKKLKIDHMGDLNERIVQEGAGNMILIQEAMQEARISEIAEKIVNRKDVRFVMIAGPSSSGKTTFSHRLSIQLRAKGKNPHPLALDNYYRNRSEYPLDEFGKKDYESLWALNVERFNQDMQALMRGELIELPYYDFVNGISTTRGEHMQMGKDDILVIEGIHGLNDQLSYSLPKESKFKIYISALTQLNIDEHNRIPTTDGRLIRRMVRDARTRGTTARETIERWPSIRRGEDKNIFPFQEEADEIFNSALVYELACLKLYAEPLLFGIKPQDPEYSEAKRLLKFLDYCIAVPSENVPNNSILREFIGGSVLNV